MCFQMTYNKHVKLVKYLCDDPRCMILIMFNQSFDLYSINKCRLAESFIFFLIIFFSLLNLVNPFKISQLRHHLKPQIFFCSLYSISSLQITKLIFNIYINTFKFTIHTRILQKDGLKRQRSGYANISQILVPHELKLSVPSLLSKKEKNLYPSTILKHE